MMTIYIAFAIALLAFITFSFLNSDVFGRQPDTSAFTGSSNFFDKSFQNQSPTPMMTKDANYWKLMREIFNKPKSNTPSEIIQSVKTDLKNLSVVDDSLIWFGHSSYLLTIGGKRILVDPVFYKASPVSFFGKPYKMTYQYLPKDFPDIDLLVITHDHYDHLDHRAVCELKPKVKSVITSKGVDGHLKLWGYKAEQIIALNWNDKAIIEGNEFICVPARHFSGRKFKRGQTLWSSFVLNTPSAKIYLGGDSGYDTHFKEIGEKYGPFDLAILECGQYGRYWPVSHMLPEETLQASKDLKAKALLPVHWGKFSLSSHPWTEPVERLLIANADEAQVVFTPQIGEVLELSSENKTVKWWR